MNRRPEQFQLPLADEPHQIRLLRLGAPGHGHRRHLRHPQPLRLVLLVGAAAGLLLVVHWELEYGLRLVQMSATHDILRATVLEWDHEKFDGHGCDTETRHTDAL